MTQLFPSFDSLTYNQVSASAIDATNVLEAHAVLATSIPDLVYPDDEREQIESAPGVMLAHAEWEDQATSHDVDTMRVRAEWEDQATSHDVDQGAYELVPSSANQPGYTAATYFASSTDTDTAVAVAPATTGVQAEAAISVGIQVSTEELVPQAVDVHANAANEAVQALLNIANSATQALVALANQIPPGLQALPSIETEAPARPTFHRFNSAHESSSGDEYQPTESLHSVASSGLSSIHGYVDSDGFFVEGSPLPSSPGPFASSPLPPSSESSESEVSSPTPALGSPFATPPVPARACTLTADETARREALRRAAVLRVFSRRYGHMQAAFSAAAVGAAQEVLTSAAPPAVVTGTAANLVPNANAQPANAPPASRTAPAQEVEVIVISSDEEDTEPPTATPREAAQPVEGTSRTAGQPVEGTSRTSGQPIAGTSRRTGQPVAGTSRSAGQPVASTSRSAGQPVAGTSRNTGVGNSGAETRVHSKKRPNLRGSAGGPLKKYKRNGDDFAN